MAWSPLISEHPSSVFEIGGGGVGGGSGGGSIGVGGGGGGGDGGDGSGSGRGGVVVLLLLQLETMQWTNPTMSRLASVPIIFHYGLVSTDI